MGIAKTRALAARRKLVLIEWVDSHSCNGWQPLDEIASVARPVYCRSVGWVVSETKETTVLVAHVSGERNEDLRLYGTGDMAIPRKAIVKTTTLLDR